MLSRWSIEFVDKLLFGFALCSSISRIISKWFMAVIVRKIIVEASGSLELKSDNKFWKALFLEEYSFKQVCIMYVLVGLVGVSVFTSAINSWPEWQASRVAEKLRHQIVSSSTKKGLEKYLESNASLGKSIPDGSPLSASATVDVVLRKVALVQSYRAKGYLDIQEAKCMIVLGGITIFVLSWIFGLAAVSMFAGQHVVRNLTEKIFLNPRRKKAGNILDQVVNARTIDILRCSDVIAMHNQQEVECQQLKKLEKQLHPIWKSVSWIRFFSFVIIMAILGSTPLVVAVVTFNRLSTLSTSDALDESFTLVGCYLLMDEIHKSILQLTIFRSKQMDAESHLADINHLFPIPRNQRKKRKSPKSVVDNDTKPNKQVAIISPQSDSSDLEAQSTFSTKSNDDYDDDTMSESSYHSLPPLRENEAIDFRHITLKMNGRSHKPLLDDFNFTFRKGKVYGLVGDSGVGKSTLLKLLCGLMKKEKGTIMTQSGPLNAKTLPHIRERIMSVSQDSLLFARTIRENICYGSEENSMFHSPEKMEKALKMAGIDEWIASLPDGIDTKLSGQHSISGGQAQRIQLARMFYADRGDIVLLDECVSALDPGNKAKLIDSIGQFLQSSNRTAIIVTHHYDILALCDKVYEVYRKNDAIKLRVFNRRRSFNVVKWLSSASLKLQN